ncbi:MAG: hypothetical protein LBV08_02820 [Clostridiales bacterium]|jgi:spore germination protein YaaH|nr:hypothetical protein [Clostridiales bacterium]
MSKRKKGHSSGGNLIIVMFVTLLILGMSIYVFIFFFMPNRQVVPYYKHYTDLSESETGVLIGSERADLPNLPLVQNNEAYLPIDFVKDHIDKYILWENGLNLVTITNVSKVMRVEPGQATWLVNEKPESFSTPFALNNQMAYIPISFLNSFYNVNINYNQEYNLITVELGEDAKTTASVPESTPLRYEPDFRSPIIEKLAAQEVVLFEEQDKFTKVRTDKGLVGFIDTKKLSSPTEVTGTEPEPEPLPPLKNPINGKVNLLWDMITNKDANNAESKLIIPEGVNVLSPTWFTFDSEALNGDIIDLGDAGYVERAHENNVQVWALATDGTNTIASAILKNSETRRHVISQLLNFCDIYNLDGINIDFERVSEDIAPDYLQFLREFYPLMREKGLVLSVDMYVPTYTMQYNRTETSKVFDYLCVMTYDEYTNADGMAGPVASYNFVEKGILDTLEEVPKEKVLMGIPLYSRIWKGDTIDQALGPKMTTKFFEDRGIQFNWDESVKLNYAEFSESISGEAVTYRAWLEDDRSLEEKMILFSNYNLAGVCSWVRGFETENTFDIISNYLNN